MIAGGTPVTKAIPQEKYIGLMRTRKNTIGREQSKKKCEICGKIMLRRSISRHMKTIHASKPTRYSPITETENGTYRIRVKKNQRTECPVEGCPGGGMDKHSIYRHFCFKHPRAKSSLPKTENYRDVRSVDISQEIWINIRGQKSAGKDELEE